MAIRTILTAPNPILRQKSQSVVINDGALERETRKLIRDLIVSLKASKIPGLGLSAPQIEVNKRIFVVNLDFPKSITNYQTFINPEITWFSKELNSEVLKEEELYLEGCLSIPKVYALIKRPYQIKLHWLSIDLDKEKISKRAAKLKGFNATVIQHEIDHLDGVLFTDHALKQRATLYEDKEGKFREIMMG